MRTRQVAPSHASLTPVSGGLAFDSSYDAGLVAEFKRRIPGDARRWDGNKKRWLVSTQYGQTCADLAQAFLGVAIAVPTQAHMPTLTQTRLIKLEYLGACKVRGANEPSAYGWADGSWSVIFPESPLREWFEAVPDKPGEKPTLYAVLTVKPTATADEIKRSFRRLALQWHPDTSKEPDAATQFKAIKAAYDVLADELKRRKYDAGRALEASIHQQGQAIDKRGGLARHMAVKSFNDVSYRPPLRCGYVLVDGQEALGRFTVEKIHGWEDITRADGKTMTTSWPAGADRFVVEWV